MFSTVFSPESLLNESTRNEIIVIDCRFELINTHWGDEQYVTGHIPGAYYAHLDNDLSSPVTATSGRHPLPDLSAFCTLVASWDIHPGKQVVVYDQNNGGYASRLWWLLKYVGHQNVAILDGGFEGWTDKHLPISTEIPVHKNTIAPYPCHPNDEMLVIDRFVNAVLHNPKYLLLDARSPDRFLGENETIDPVAGHIPGALSRYHALSLNEKGFYRDAADLQNELRQLTLNRSVDKIIVYCGSGVTSCNLVMSFEHAGLGLPKLYAGSWSEWIKDRHHPVSK